jgi:hypothetical protein
VDRRFVGDAVAQVPPGTRIAGEEFGPIECGSFHAFWRKR